MSEFPLGYDKIEPATWAYLSSLLMIALYFKFNRLWSVRNLDIVLLVLLAPGLVMVHNAQLDRGPLLQMQREAIDAAESTPPPMNEPLATEEVGGNGQEGDALMQDTDSSAVADTSAALDGQSTQQNEESSATLSMEEMERLLARNRRAERNGFIFLFVAGTLLLIRMLIDSAMIRRPLLEPNLTNPGLVFLGVSLLIFLLANVITGLPHIEDLKGPQAARALIEPMVEEPTPDQYKLHGPGYPLLYFLPVIPTAVNQVNDWDAQHRVEQRADILIAKAMAIVGQLAIVAGLVVIGFRHFNNGSMGIGAATLYLLLPYTAQMTGRVTHALPAALMVWALASYRRPLVAGGFIGLAMGMVYYPLFLLPLWVSFYWRRGKWRFLLGFAIMLFALGVVLAFSSESLVDYIGRLRAMFGIWSPQTEGLRGIWSLGWDAIFRLPLLAGFVLLSITFAIWPTQKNFGTLLNCSCALMIAVQFWHGFGGGLYMAWYLPALLLTIFRPNLDDRVALSVLDEGWRRKRKRTRGRVVGTAAA